VTGGLLQISGTGHQKIEVRSENHDHRYLEFLGGTTAFGTNHAMDYRFYAENLGGGGDGVNATFLLQSSYTSAVAPVIQLTHDWIEIKPLLNVMELGSGTDTVQVRNNLDVLNETEFHGDVTFFHNATFDDGDLEIKGDLDISGSVVVEELYKVKTFPLITQIHSFIQPNVNAAFTPPFFLSHVPSYDSNRVNVVPFIKCVTNIMPYAMVIGTDADPEDATEFVFEVRATSATDETDYSSLTYSSTTYRGTITFSNIQEKTSEKVTVTSPSPILDGQLWGLYLVSATGHSGTTYGGELVMKLFFYQGEYSV
jgi:hypothetical protein